MESSQQEQIASELKLGGLDFKKYPVPYMAQMLQVTPQPDESHPNLASRFAHLDYETRFSRLRREVAEFRFNSLLVTFGLLAISGVSSQFADLSRPLEDPVASVFVVSALAACFFVGVHVACGKFDERYGKLIDRVATRLEMDQQFQARIDRLTEENEGLRRSMGEMVEHLDGVVKVSRQIRKDST